MKENSKHILYRPFFGTICPVGVGLTILPSSVISGLGRKTLAPSGKLNIAVIGIGGMGNSNLTKVSPTENIIATCDVDWGIQKKNLLQSQMPKFAGIGDRCMMKSANHLMQSAYKRFTRNFLISTGVLLILLDIFIFKLKALYVTSTQPVFLWIFLTGDAPDYLHDPKGITIEAGWFKTTTGFKIASAGIVLILFLLYSFCIKN